MLDLEKKTTEEVEINIMPRLRAMFDADYRSTKDMSVHLPRGEVTPAYLHVLADACAVLSEATDLSGRIERRWQVVVEELSKEHRHRKQRKEEAERAAGIQHGAELKDMLKVLKTGEERREWLAQFLPDQVAEEVRFADWVAEAQGWLQMARRRYQQLMDQRRMVDDLQNITKQVIWLRGGGGPSSEGPDGVRRGVTPDVMQEHPMFAGGPSSEAAVDLSGPGTRREPAVSLPPGEDEIEF